MGKFTETHKSTSPVLVGALHPSKPFWLIRLKRGFILYCSPIILDKIVSSRFANISLIQIPQIIRTAAKFPEKLTISWAPWQRIFLAHGRKCFGIGSRKNVLGTQGVLVDVWLRQTPTVHTIGFGYNGRTDTYFRFPRHSFIVLTLFLGDTMCHLSTNTYKWKVFHVEDDVSLMYWHRRLSEEKFRVIPNRNRTYDLVHMLYY